MSDQSSDSSSDFEVTIRKELSDILDNQKQINSNHRKLTEALRFLMEAVNILKEEVQDGDQRSIKKGE